MPDEQRPTDLATEYYGQRASEGAFLLTETTFISRGSSRCLPHLYNLRSCFHHAFNTEAGGYRDAPAIHSQEQIDAWRKVTTAVHDKGAFIFSQLNAAGRANYADSGAPLLADVETVAPSPIGLSGNSHPIEMSLTDIERYIQQYKQAALNARLAGFDGVEIQGGTFLLFDRRRPLINANGLGHVSLCSQWLSDRPVHVVSFKQSYRCLWRLARKPHALLA